MDRRKQVNYYVGASSNTVVVRISITKYMLALSGGKGILRSIASYLTVAIVDLPAIYVIKNGFLG